MTATAVLSELRAVIATAEAQSTWQAKLEAAMERLTLED